MTPPPSYSGRIVAPYTISLELHHARAYVHLDPAPATPPNILYRTAASVSWRLAAEQWAVRIGPMIDGGFGAFLLQEWSGVVWNTIDTYTPTATPSGSIVTLASQNTLVFRDTTFRQIKVELMEGPYTALNHVTTPPGTGAPIGDLINSYLSTGPNANDPYHWAVSRTDNYLNGSGTFVGWTMSFNRKLRRRRGLT